MLLIYTTLILFNFTFFSFLFSAFLFLQPSTFLILFLGLLIHEVTHFYYIIIHNIKNGTFGHEICSNDRHSRNHRTYVASRSHQKSNSSQKYNPISTNPDNNPDEHRCSGTSGRNSKDRTNIEQRNNKENNLDI